MPERGFASILASTSNSFNSPAPHLNKWKAQYANGDSGANHSKSIVCPTTKIPRSGSCSPLLLLSIHCGDWREHTYYWSPVGDPVGSVLYAMRFHGLVAIWDWLGWHILPWSLVFSFSRLGTGIYFVTLVHSWSILFYFIILPHRINYN